MRSRRRRPPYQFHTLSVPPPDIPALDGAQMWFRPWFQAQRRVLILFLAITLVPTAALGWLGWRILKQDRALEMQRQMAEPELLADRIPPALDRTLAELEKRLDGSQDIPDDTVVLSADSKSFEAKPVLL